MSSLGNRNAALSAAARPTLFDAVRSPDLLISLILANLMSPSVWEFRDQIEERIADQPASEPADRESIILGAIHG